jgi:fluoroquinolone transport system ATP-binding protein
MMIEAKSLTFTYPGAAAPAVHDVSFTLKPGRILGFLGRSGAGKTTVQNLTIGLLPLKQGEVLYEGRPVASLGRSFFEHVGVSFEHPNLYLKLTGLENLTLYGGLFSGPSLPAERVLEMVGLTDARHKRAAAYSKGMKHRLVFARAIMNRPDVLFLDEPTAGLDPDTSRRIKAIILEERQRGAAIFLTTHDMTVADELCDQVAFINEGRLIAQDAPRNLKLLYGERAVRVEYRRDDEVQAETLFLDRQADRSRFNELLDGGSVETVHSQEATLEQIFIKLTGRGLA